MNTQLKIIVTITIISLLMLPVHAIAQPCGGYEVTAIVSMEKCPPFGIPPVVPFGINEQGWMVGFFQPCVIGPETAFLWTPEDGFVVIPMPAGTSYSRAVAISGSLIVGEYDNAELELGRTGFLYDYDTNVFTSLGTLPGGDWSEAHAINSHGEIVGFWGNTVQGPSPLAFIWRDGEMIDLNPDFGTIKSEANGITNAGLVTGWMGSSSITDARAFIWDDGTAAELPLLPNAVTSEGKAINSIGNVTGEGRVWINNNKTMVVQSFLWTANELTDLGTLPNTTFTRAAGINHQTSIIGYCHNSGLTDQAAFLWQEGEISDLNDQIPLDPNLNLKRAVGINQTGYIAVVADSDTLDATVGIILSPIVGPPGDLNNDCQITIADLLILFGEWGACVGCPADLDGNGTVNTSDLLILFSNWG